MPTTASPTAKSPINQHELGDAFRVEAHIVIWEKSDALQVPAGALFRIGNEWTVFVIQNGRAVPRTVSIGKNNGKTAEVLAGLQESDSVILYPSDNIRPNIQVRSVR